MINLQQWLVSQAKVGLAEKEWSQAHVARKAGLTRQHLHRMLTGQQIGSVESWDRVLTALGIELESTEEDHGDVVI